MEQTGKSLRAHRIAISSCFFFYGFVFATWASRIPNIQQHLNLSETALGATLLSMPIGSFVTVPFSGFLSSKIGSRKVVIMASLIYCVLLIAIGFSQTVWQLALCLFLFGSAGNMMNIAINTQAITLEGFYTKRIISSFHGMWSVAGLGAAALGTYFIGLAFPVGYHFLLVAIVALLSFTFCFSYLLQEPLKPQERRPLFTKPDKAFWGLGLIAFCSMICQGAMFDWSGVYFKKVVLAQPAFIGIGYTAFVFAMTAVRFISDWLSHHIGFRKIIVSCGILTTIGLVTAAMFPYLIPATVGLLFVGMGVSPGVPLVYSAAAKSNVLPAPIAIAAVSSIGMIGLLIGPPIIGFIAGLTSLKTSFSILSLFGVAIIVLAVTLKKEH